MHKIIGVKIYDYTKSWPRLFEEWQQLSINTAFVSPALAARPEFRERAARQGIAVFIITPTFNNRSVLE